MSSHYRIMLIGAHPDDCEGLAGGYAMKMAALGHEVLIFSMTDGGLGHYALSPAELIKIRRKEAERAAELAGATSRMMDIPDGHLEPTLENRKRLAAEIRTFAPHLIITHRPNDYHPDHRSTGMLVRDVSYMLQVPGFCPGVPVMRRMPHIMYFKDGFQDPPFMADVVIGIDDVYLQKYAMMACHASQYFDWLPWIDHTLDEVPEGEDTRLLWLRSPLLTDPEDPDASGRSEQGWHRETEKLRDQLVARYGDAGRTVDYCEAFQMCEYGADFDEEDLAAYFPWTTVE